VPEVVPSVPPLRALGKVISDNVLVRAILFPLVPGVRAVMVTAAPLELAVTPSAVGQAAIAAARFVAWIVVLEFSPKVPVKVGAVPVQAFAAPGAGIVPVLGFKVMAELLFLKVMLPLVVLVMVVTAPEAVAEALALALVIL
jgi:hypothetical protein